jgi:WS/DGAT/MGAT family acyltransferase
LHHLRLPSPGDDDALATLISDLVSAPLPRDRPLWQAYVVDDVDGGTMLFVRIHHAVGDGVALVRLLMSFCDEQVRAPAAVGLPGVQTRGVLDRGKRAVAQVSTLARLLFLPKDNQSPLRGTLGLRKRIAWSGPLLLSDVRGVAEAIDGTVHDVLQSCVAGAVQRYLTLHSALPAPENLRSMVTVYLRNHHAEHDLGNHFSLVFLDLPVGPMNAMERLRLVKARMDKLKRAEDATVGFAVLDAIGRAHDSLEHFALEEFTRKATLVTTNVPGPPETASFGGHRLRTMLVWAPTASSLGLGFTMVSYGEEVRVGILADAHRVSNPEVLATAFEVEFSELLNWSRTHPGS